MADPRFVINNHSNVAHKELDLSANLPLAAGDSFYTDEIPAGNWQSKGMDLSLNTLNAQIEVVTQISFDKTSPKRYAPAFHPVLGSQLEYTVASTGTDPGSFSLTIDFDGDWVRYKITNTGSVPITDLTFIAILANNPNLS